MKMAGLACARATPCALHRRFRSIPGTRLFFGVPGHRESRIMPSSHTRPVELLSYISCRLLATCTAGLALFAPQDSTCLRRYAACELALNS
jgi:hypothetical protein